MLRRLSPRLRWYLLVSLTAPPTGVLSAIGVLALSNFQVELNLSGAQLLAPLALGPLVVLAGIHWLGRPAELYARLAGGVLFILLAFVGEFSFATWIAAQDHP